jgi:hypothetical protein
VLFKASSFARALQYLIDLNNSGTRVHAVSMSMGGVPSQLWADIINAAYDAGITVVTAAGNNFNGLPTRKLIYPARFNRVIAACGVTYDYAPYFIKKLGEMQGNWGPEKKYGKGDGCIYSKYTMGNDEQENYKFFRCRNFFCYTTNCGRQQLVIIKNIIMNWTSLNRG